MAHMTQEKKKALAPAIKAVLKKHGMKGTLAIENHSCLVCNLKSGVIDFGTKNLQVTPYGIEERWADNPIARDFLLDLVEAMNVGNHGNSNIITDYFDVGWYIKINVGKWDKDYVVTE